MDKLRTDTLTWLDRDEPIFTLLDAAVDKEPGEPSPLGVIALCGSSQAGKTRLVNTWAARHGADVLSIQAQLDQPEDISGFPFRTGQVVNYTHPNIIPPGFIDRIGDYVIFLDELDKAQESVLSCLLTLLAERRLSLIHI